MVENPEDREELLEQLVAEYVVRRQDEPEDPLPELCSRHPRLADTLRRRVEEMERVQGLLGEVRPSAKLPSRFGHYRILRELGRGGMGVVYLAEDERLERRVALKALPSALGDPFGTSTRFRREVRAIAQLQHPHIVPVFDVGEEDGVPYFTMQYIEGRTLSVAMKWLRGLGLPPTRLAGSHLRRATTTQEPAEPTEAPPEAAEPDTPAPSPAEFWSKSYVETTCRIVSDIARALQHTHRGGVIHRDIKPSNIMLQDDGKALLFDFGLARIEADRSLTLTGDFAGTPYYVSPEQVAGNRAGIDHRTDVYSLGVTLYELLTLQVPYRGETTQQIFKQILVKEPVPLRRLNPLVPRDLETICLTAMEKDPDRRYQDAGDLAEDLQRFLDYRPIQARPLGPLPKTLRFMRRNRAATVAAVLAFLVVVVGPLVFGVYHKFSSDRIAAAKEKLATEQKQTASERDRANRNYDEARRQAQEAERARQRAERYLEKALDAVEQMLSRVAETRLLHVPQMERLRRTLLLDARDFQQSLLDEDSTDPRVRETTAVAYFRLGGIHEELGEIQAAEEAYQSSLALYDGLVEEFPGAGEFTHSQAQIHVNLGNLLNAVNQPEQAEEEFRSAQELWESLLDEGHEKPRFLRDLAGSHLNLGNALIDQGRFEEAIEEFFQAEDGFEELLEQSLDGGSEYQHGLALADLNRAMALRSTERYLEADRTLVRAASLLEELLEEEPGHAVYRDDLARSHYQLGLVLEQLERPEEAETASLRAIELWAALSADFPNVPGYQYYLGHTHHNLGLLLEATGQLDRAASMLRAATEVHTRLLSVLETATFRADLVRFHENLGEVQLGMGDHEAAADSVAAMLRVSPEEAEPRHQASHRLVLCADRVHGDTTLPADERKQRAGVYLDQAVEQLRQAVRLGYEDLEHLEEAPGFDPLRERADFQALLEELRARSS